MLDNLLDAKEAAKIAGVSYDVIIRHMRSGKLEFVYDPNTIKKRLIFESWIKEYLKKNKVSGRKRLSWKISNIAQTKENVEKIEDMVNYYFSKLPLDDLKKHTGKTLHSLHRILDEYFGGIKRKDCKLNKTQF